MAPCCFMLCSYFVQLTLSLAAVATNEEEASQIFKPRTSVRVSVRAAQKGQVVHKTKMTIDGSLYSINVFQTENHIAFSVIDNLTSEVHKVKTKSKAKDLSSKSLREKEFFYEELLSRLSFKVSQEFQQPEDNNFQ